MQCICGVWLELNAYGFHKCHSCSRIYGHDEQGTKYLGFEKEVK